MSRSICPRVECGGYLCLEDEDGLRRCLMCNRAVNPIIPLPMVNGAGNLGHGIVKRGKGRDRLVGYKATGKGPGSLAR